MSKPEETIAKLKAVGDSFRRKGKLTLAKHFNDAAVVIEDLDKEIKKLKKEKEM